LRERLFDVTCSHSELEHDHVALGEIGVKLLDEVKEAT
jgi:hypothetical protein